MVKVPLGKFLRPEEIQDGDIVTITDEGKVVSADDSSFNRESFEVTIDFNGTTKTWTMNTKTCANLTEAWGDDSVKWIGKNVELSKVKRDVFGVERWVITGIPAAEQKKIDDAKEVKK